MGKRINVGIAALLAAAAALVSSGQAPVAADPGAGAVVLVGSGSVEPGFLTVASANQTYTFTTANVLGVPSVIAGINGVNVGAGLASCAYSLDSTMPENAVLGTGTGTGSCSTATSLVGTVSDVCTLTYTRIGLVMVMTSTCTHTVDGASTGVVGESVFVLIPTSVNPFTSYQVAGASAFVP